MRKILLISIALVASLLCSLSAVAAEAYACYTPSNTTLAFYYDNYRSSRTGTTYDVNTDGGQSGWYEPGWYTDNTSASVTRVVFNSSFANARPHTTRYWFCGMRQLQSIIGLNYLNTSQVATMHYMFGECALLTSLDLSGFNTSQVTDMDMMFKGCSGLTSINLSSFNTENVQTMSGMFDSCKALEKLNLSNFRTPKVKYMREMFADCSGLTSLNVRSFDTANVLDMRLMFYGCNNLTELDISSFNTAIVNDMLGMFRNCTKLTTIYAAGRWSIAAEDPSTEMFYGCTKLKGGLGTTFDASHVSAKYAHIDGGPSNPGYFTYDFCLPMAYACYTPSNTTLTFYYDTYHSSRVGTIYYLNADKNDPAWYKDSTCRSVTRVVFNSSFANARPESTRSWFGAMENLKTIDGLAYLNTSDVTDMSSMFYNCKKMTSINVSSLNTANVTDMSFMFSGCSSITSLDVSGFNTANVENMCNTFAYCTNLTSLNLSNFNTANVEDMSNMFIECDNLTSIDLSSFNTSNVTRMWQMFASCDALKQLDLSSFNTAKVYDMATMFFYCINLKTIYVGSGWSTANVTISNAMFNGCYSLVGGKGTTYDANYIDKTYAHIDGGTSNPGYLTNITHPYAVFTPLNNTLTFYYDSQRFSRSGRTYSLNAGNTNPDWVSDYSYSAVKRVVFDSSFATARPTSTYRWFYMMDKLQSITGLNYLNTSQVTNMSNMFNLCGQLTAIDVSNFDTHNVTDMSYMFMFCSAVTSLDVSSFNTAKVTNMWGMFNGCTALKTLDLRSFNTSRVTDMMAMFHSCENLKTIYAGSGWSTVNVTSSTDMFYMCYSLVGSKGTTYDASHVDKAYAHIDGGPSNPGYLSTPGIEAYAVYTPSNTTLTFYYDMYRSSRAGTTYALNIDNQFPGWYNDGTYSSVTNVTFDQSFVDARPTTTFCWFQSMENLKTITGLSRLNTSQVTNMRRMFFWCKNLKTLDLSSFNTDKVTNMQEMFVTCYSLTSINVSSFNTALVTNMEAMFMGCMSLTSLDLSNFNTARVTDMHAMFNACAFSTLDLSSFNTAKVTNMESMFKACDKLTTIHVGNGWSTASVTSSTDMFNSCFSLVGCRGTTYDANHVDAAYAHIDGGSIYPGYLSAPLETYACYTPSNTTLTFYCDGKRATRTGTTYDAGNTGSYPAWYLDDTSNEVTKVVFDPSFAGARPTSTAAWFMYMPNLTYMTGEEYLNTSEVTDMSYMYALTNFLGIELDGFNTSKVKNMYGMFANCSYVDELDLSYFNTSQVTDMGSMFRGCSNLKTIYVGPDWYTFAVTSSSNMFKDCPNLVGGKGTTYDANHVDVAYAHIDGGPSDPGYLSDRNEAYAVYTSSNTTLVFYYDDLRESRSGTTYDLNTGRDVPGWYTDGTNASVTRVVFNSSFYAARPVSTYRWFAGMTNLTTLTGLNYLNTSAVTNMSQMFWHCYNLKSLNVSGFNTSQVTDMSSMFSGCYNLTSLDVSNFTTSKVTDMGGMFNDCGGLTSLDVSNFNTSKVTDMYAMFSGCAGLTSLDVSDLNTTQVTDMSSMFSYCTGLTNLDLSTFDTGKVTCMQSMFEGSSGLTSLDLSSFNTSHVTDMMLMFCDCSGLTSLDVSSFETDKVRYMESMFSGCSSLTNLDVSNFWTPMVSEMAFMFNGCSSLTSLNLSRFNTGNMWYCYSMFSGCSDLTTIYVADGWDLDDDAYGGNMFNGCVKLRGSKGTTYDPEHVDEEYAHIDGGPGNPGYLSDILLGDVNGDGEVNIADVVDIIDYLLKGDASALNLAAADVDFDGTVSIADVADVIDYLLKGSW